MSTYSTQEEITNQVISAIYGTKDTEFAPSEKLIEDGVPGTVLEEALKNIERGLTERNVKAAYYVSGIYELVFQNNEYEGYIEPLEIFDAQILINRLRNIPKD